MIPLALTVTIIAIGWTMLLAEHHTMAWLCAILALPLCFLVFRIG